MTQEHPITPLPELVEKWGVRSQIQYSDESWAYELFIATQAARWGANQELDACCEWLKTKEWIHPEFSDELRDFRRPKPPSLKELALAEMELLETEGSHAVCMTTLRRALEALPND